MQNRTRLLFQIIIVMVIAFVCANLYYLYFAALRADKELYFQNKASITTYIEGANTERLTNLQRLSVSSPLFDSLKQNNNRYFQETVCKDPYIYENVFATLVIDKSGRILNYCEYGRVDDIAAATWLADPIKEDLSELNKDIDEFYAQYRTITPEFRKRTSLQKIDKEVYSVTLAQIVPSQLRQQSGDLKYYYLATYVNFNRVMLSKMSETLPVTNLHIAASEQISQEQAPMVIKMGKKNDIYLIWDYSNSYADLYKKFIPTFILASSVFVLAILFYLRKIAEMQKQIVVREQAAIKASLHDNMTGLPNRKYFNDTLKHILENRPANAMCFVGFIDLDKFKNINDTHGHDVGDAIIVAAAERIKKTLGDENFCARLGGDEFAFIITGDISIHELNTCMTQLTDMLKWPVAIHQHEHWPSASIGICECPKYANTPSDALKLADYALYKSKNMGRGTYHIFSQSDKNDIGNTPGKLVSL